MATTAGRVTTDRYAWMQAVHWMHGAGLHESARRHGPRFNRTTIQLAEVLGDFTPCRPGLRRLIQLTGLSRRSVQYHLEILRESGLIAYVARGTRLRGGVARASEFLRTIPVAFDRALGIRTVIDDGKPARERRPVGIAEEHREEIAKLGKRARRRARRRRPRSRTSTSRSARGLCTPMQDGCSSSSGAGPTALPPEDKLGGEDGHPARKQITSRRARRVNAVGRRFRMAAELIRSVPWLARASVPRIAWVIRRVADAGWTTDEVRAFLDTTDAPRRVVRPSGLLAYRLKNAEGMPGWTDPASRARTVEAWRDSPRAAAARHAEWDGPWRPPASAHVRRQVHAALTAALHRPASDAGGSCDVDDAAPPPALEDLPPETVLTLRAEAARDASLVRFALDHAGEAYARRLYTHCRVDQVLRSARQMAR
ncbi:helix-turn-helix domain-containing protein [Streptomyces nanshensis]|uniref:helix-turn-helix domain-containing protein n=1 Tax=Streptomyces nanshensis TaxID=518642 RepID=UPI00085C1749|nr:helix-turn-helix domain-containing protein [Streptomyces nanshensis]